jgi:HK97 family phage major capsid protein
MPQSATSTRRLDWLRHQRESNFGELTEMCERAAGEDRDLTDAEQSAVDTRREALTHLDAELATEAELARAQGSYQELMAGIGPVTGSTPAGASGAATPASAGGTGRGEVYRSAGEYLYDYIAGSQHFPGGRDEQARARFESYRANMTTADTPGVLPTPILGPVWTSISSRRPAIEAATIRPLPAGGKTFQRPYVSQHTNVGNQSAEKTALPSQPLKIDPKTVTKMTRGGWVNLSFQDRDWTDPAILDILVADLAAMYAQDTDDQFTDDLVAGVTQTVPVATNDSVGWLTAIYEAAAMVAGPDNRMANTMWVSVDVWAQLGALVDTAGRPLFPTVAPGNAMGDLGPTNMFQGSVAGLRLAVDGHFTAGTAIIGDNAAVEFYETVGGQVQAVEPSLLGVAIAFYGYMADCIVAPTALVKLTPPAGALGTAGRTTSKDPGEPEKGSNEKASSGKS